MRRIRRRKRKDTKRLISPQCELLALHTNVTRRKVCACTVQDVHGKILVDRSENLDIDGKIILKYVLNKEFRKVFHLNMDRG